MKCKLLVLFIAFTLSCNSFAYDSSNVAREVASVLRGKAVVRGFPLNDPRVTGLVGAAGTVVTEIAVGAAVAGTAPAWGAIIASGLIAGTVGYGINSLANWLFNKDGTVTQSSGGSGTAPAGQCYTANGSGCYASMTDAAAFVIGQPGTTTVTSSSPSPGYSQTVTLYYKPGMPVTYYNRKRCTTWNDGSASPCSYDFWSNATGGPTVPDDTQGGVLIALKQGSPGSVVYPDTQGPTTKPVQEAIEALPELQKGVAIPAQTIADVADAVWRQMASKPGYNGVPYSFSDPVTATDVEADRAANPSRPVPRIGDLAAPISTSNPLAEPSTSPVNDPVVNPSTQPQVNLGDDPGIGAPTLEATPTAQQIIDPLAGLAPSLRNWAVPAHLAECPKPAFDLFGKHIIMDQQCSMFEENRPTLYNAMLVAWALIALFIVLSA